MGVEGREGMKIDEKVDESRAFSVLGDSWVDDGRISRRRDEGNSEMSTIGRCVMIQSVITKR